MTTSVALVLTELSIKISSKRAIQSFRLIDHCKTRLKLFLTFMDDVFWSISQLCDLSEPSGLSGLFSMNLFKKFMLRKNWEGWEDVLSSEN